MLALLDVNPLLPGPQAEMHPVARELARPVRTRADPGDKPDHSVSSQQRFEIINLVAVYGAFGQHHNADRGNLVQGGDKHPIHQI
jgi:hypothetical protein